jgi:hypothetical protein
MKIYMFHAKNKFVKLVNLDDFITKKIVTMYGHMNVKLEHFHSLLSSSCHLSTCYVQKLKVEHRDL